MTDSFLGASRDEPGRDEILGLKHNTRTVTQEVLGVSTQIMFRPTVTRLRLCWSSVEGGRPSRWRIVSRTAHASKTCRKRIYIIHAVVRSGDERFVLT